MGKNIQLVLALICIAWSSISCAEYAVITHPNNSATITSDDVQKLFLAKTAKFPNGQLAIPINQTESNEARQNFDNSVLGKTPSQMKSYWSRLIFTGKAVPIKQVENDTEVLELVRDNQDAIGYVDSSKVTSDVRVAFTYQ